MAMAAMTSDGQEVELPDHFVQASAILRVAMELDGPLPIPMTAAAVGLTLQLAERARAASREEKPMERTHAYFAAVVATRDKAIAEAIRAAHVLELPDEWFRPARVLITYEVLRRSGVLRKFGVHTASWRGGGLARARAWLVESYPGMFDASTAMPGSFRTVEGWFRAGEAYAHDPVFPLFGEYTCICEELAEMFVL